MPMTTISMTTISMSTISMSTISMSTASMSMASMSTASMSTMSNVLCTVYCGRGCVRLESELKEKNTKNWYTIDALGAIFAIFIILDTFTIL